MASIDFSNRAVRSPGRSTQTMARVQAARQRVQLKTRPSEKPETAEAQAHLSPVRKASTLTQFAGTLTSLALIGGLAYWGYTLAVRDVSGVPVVRAMSGPLRVQPDDPGGKLADYQGLAVNRIQAKGGVAPAPDRLVLAPAPVDVIKTDPPGIAPRLRPEPPRQIAEATPTAEAGEADLATPEIVTPALLNPADDIGPATATAPADAPKSAGEIAAAARALAEQVAANAVPLSDETGAEGSAKPEIKIIPASVPGVVKSVRPLQRPADLMQKVARLMPEATASAATEKAGASPQSSVDLDPASLPPHTSLAQLGAFDSADLARKEWARLTARFPDYFGGKSRVIQAANNGGRSFFRLRVAGFDDLSDARRFCSSLLTENAACIPVVTR